MRGRWRWWRWKSKNENNRDRFRCIKKARANSATAGMMHLGCEHRETSRRDWLTPSNFPESLAGQVCQPSGGDGLRAKGV
jgi:hypothetical protein